MGGRGSFFTLCDFWGRGSRGEAGEKEDKPSSSSRGRPQRPSSPASPPDSAAFPSELAQFSSRAHPAPSSAQPAGGTDQYSIPQATVTHLLLNELLQLLHSLLVVTVTGCIFRVEEGDAIVLDASPDSCVNETTQQHGQRVNVQAPILRVQSRQHSHLRRLGAHRFYGDGQRIQLHLQRSEFTVGDGKDSHTCSKEATSNHAISPGNGFVVTKLVLSSHRV